MEKESQTKQIRAWLESGKSITPVEALKHFGCFRLSGRIYDLKERGMNITTTMVDDGDKRFAKYSMEAI